MSLRPSGPSRVADASVRKNPIAALFLVLGLLAASIGAYAVAGADTTVTPSGPGAIGAEVLTRDAVVNVTVNPGGLTYKKANAAGTYAPLNLGAAAILDLLGCAGDNGADAPQAGGNRSPWTKVTVTGPAGFTPVNYYSPAINSIALAPPFSPVVPQPTAPSSSGYRGLTPPAQGGTPIVEPVTLGSPGVYTVTTTIRNMVKTGLGTCTIGTPATGTGTVLPAGTVLPGGGVVQANGLIIETHTFEYRPWQHVFTDIGGQGKVSFNHDPAESQQQVGPATGAIIPGGMHFYKVPGLDAFALPADPSECATDPASCLPTGALECDPSAGCDARLVIISRSQPSETLQGIFDLDTGAFIALGRVGNTGRIMFSLGTKLDPLYAGIIPSLRAAAAALGMEIDDLLGLGVVLSGGPGGREASLTLLNGLQMNPSSHKAGLNLLLNDVGLQAGLLLNVYSAIVPRPGDADATWCTAGSKSSAAGDLRFTRTVADGYTVEKSDLLPDVPAVAGLDALGVGGPIFHIDGRFKTPALVGLGGTLAGVTVDAAGLRREVTVPPTVEDPVLSAHYLLDAATAIKVPKMKKMDYLGTATWAASETDASILGCVVVDFMLGIGVQLNNNPLPIGFGNIPIWKQSPGAAALMASINAAVANVVGQVTGNPTVAGILAQITGQLPPLPVPLP